MDNHDKDVKKTHRVVRKKRSRMIFEDNHGEYWHLGQGANGYPTKKILENSVFGFFFFFFILPALILTIILILLGC